MALEIFQIDRDSSVPPFQQVQDCVFTALKRGRIAPGQKLPTVRGLAEHLEIANNTVANAYRALEKKGVLVGRGRAGTFVSPDLDAADDPTLVLAREIALEACGRLRGLGLDSDDAQTVLSEAHRATFTQ